MTQEAVLRTADILRSYARAIGNLDSFVGETDEAVEEIRVLKVLNARDALAKATLTAEQADELARLDDELRARREKIAPFLPPSNPPGRDQWWWWLHES